MLNVRIGENEVEILASGNVVEIVTDISYLIREVYQRIDGKKAKEFFGKGITDFMNDGIYKMNSEELDCFMKKQKKEKEEAVNDIANDIKELLKSLKDAVECLPKNKSKDAKK